MFTHGFGEALKHFKQQFLQRLVQPSNHWGVTVIFHLSFLLRMEDFDRPRCCLVHMDCRTYPHISMICSMDNTSLALNGRIHLIWTLYIQLQLAALRWCTLQAALSIFQVIYYPAKGVWQTRHQLRSLLSVFLQGKPQLMTTGDVHTPRRAALWVPQPHTIPISSNIVLSIPSFPFIPKGEMLDKMRWLS